jgi:hypothetical protein
MSTSLDVRRLVLVPALITLGVTLLRLAGELMHWSPVLFSREAGGAGAIVGIVWLVPVFAVYFALRLLRAGPRPALGRAALFGLAGLVVFALAVVAISKAGLGPAASIAVFGLSSVVALVVAYRGWPELGRVLLAYGLAARIPVAIVMLVALGVGWGTHYEKGPPGFPAMGVLATWFWIGAVPQLTLWIAFTVIVGMLVGAATGALRRG